MVSRLKSISVIYKSPMKFGTFICSVTIMSKIDAKPLDYIANMYKYYKNGDNHYIHILS